MICLKKWNTESAQTEYRESADYKEPYVGYVDEMKGVTYNFVLISIFNLQK